VIAEALWEVKLDVGLVVFALALSVYLPYIFGVLGLSSAGRAAAGAQAVSRTGSRMGRLQKAVQMIAITLDDVLFLGRGFIGGKSAKDTAEAIMDPSYKRERTSWTQPWSLTSWGSVFFVALSIVALIGAPAITDETLSSSMTLILAEMEPFPCDLRDGLSCFLGDA
jgi:hypothetical protein